MEPEEKEAAPKPEETKTEEVIGKWK